MRDTVHIHDREQLKLNLVRDFRVFYKTYTKWLEPYLQAMEDRAVYEELVRRGSHISQVRSVLEKGDDKDGIGRRLDFIVQEMNREANTIGSKSNDREITSSMLELKAEIEKVREQVQNIE